MEYGCDVQLEGLVLWRVQELMKQKRLEREEKEKQEQLQREKHRRMHGKEMTQVKQKYVAALSVPMTSGALHSCSILERCNPWPHVATRQLLSLWHHSQCDVSRLRRSQPPFSLWRHSHCDVIRYWTGHAHHYGHTYRHLTTFNI